MTSNQQPFILKEFIVGLIVLIFIGFLLVSFLTKTLQKPFFKNLFASKSEVLPITTKDYCQTYPIFIDLATDKTYQFERLVKRQGWRDTVDGYRLTYPEIKKNMISYAATSDSSAIPSIANKYICSQEGVVTEEIDNLLLSQLLNLYPETLNEYANFQVVENTGFLLPSSSELQQGKEWNRSLFLKGTYLHLTNQEEGMEKEGYCFSLEAKATSIFQGRETVSTKAGDFETYKIETVWGATPSASLAVKQKIGECSNYQGEYDNIANLTVKDESWYASNSALVKRQIEVIRVAGQARFLPNGFLPLSITDTLTAQ